MQARVNEIPDLIKKNENLLLPDINLKIPYHSRFLSENHKMLNERMKQDLNEDNRPINKQAMINNYLKYHLKGNLYAISNPFLLGVENNKNYNTLDQEFLENKNDYLNTNVESSRQLNSEAYLENISSNTAENSSENDKINHMTNIHRAENFKKHYAYKKTLKCLSTNNTEKFKKENFLRDINKINNMQSPFYHIEYSPSSKKHNMIKDYFKMHSEELLKFKLLERTDNTKKPR